VGTVKIGDRLIGPGHPTYVIAEIGSNHDGRIERAFALIETAAVAGADAVKFQSFTADGLVARRVPDGEGGMRDNPVYPFIDNVAVPVSWHRELKACAIAASVDFLSTPFDLARLDLLCQLDIPAIKIASGDLTFEPLLRAAARSGRPIILSTGMAEMAEIDRSVEVIRQEGNDNIVLLHCVTSYPTKLEEVNVRAVTTLAKRFKIPVGLSDHSFGIAGPLAAVALGANVIERHFTFSRSHPGPDHPFAMEPQEFRTMVEEIREIEKVLGTGRKKLVKEERRERLVGRRSIRAAQDLKKGTVLKASHLKYVRPGGGLDPFDAALILGKKLQRALAEDEQIALSDVG
jgi:sialic acid synthase SpsE